MHQVAREEVEARWQQTVGAQRRKAAWVHEQQQARAAREQASVETNW